MALKSTQGVLPVRQENSFIQRLIRDYKMHKVLIFMAIPFVLYYVVFHYAPMYGVLIAFKDYRVARGFFGSRWVGLQNFEAFFNGFYFQRLLVNTLMISLKQLIFGFPAPIIFALLLNEVKCSGYKRIVQTITYMPHFISTVVMCGMLLSFFASDGVITYILSLFGFPIQNYFLDPNKFQGLYVGSGIWQNLGWNSIIYLAAISRVNPDLYEACLIDGGGRWKQMIHVTIPQIVPTIMTLLILNLGRLMNEGADKIILLYSPATYEKADIIASYVYRMGIQGADYSLATTVGLFNNIINCILLAISNTLSRKLTETSLW